MKTYTAENVTDDEVHELLASLKKEHPPTPTTEARADMRACYAAISTGIVHSSWTRETARARIAEILNARARGATCT